jgi:hypothetical protein
MSSRKERLESRNEKIIARFLVLKEKKFQSKALYTQEAIFAMIGEEFHLSDRTVENIVFGRVNYKETE